MTRLTLVVVLTLAVGLAGCLGGPINGTTPEPSSTTDSTPVGGESPTGAVDTIPGVDDGRLTNATALFAAHEQALVDRGFAANVSRSVNGSETMRFQITASPGLSTYLLSGELVAGESGSMELWANESTRFVRQQSDGEVSYRTVARHDDSLNLVKRPGDYLRVGNFTVADEAGPAGRIVLTADGYVPPESGHGPFQDVSSFEGRAVIDAEGRIHRMELTADTDRGTVAYEFDLSRTGVAQVDRPTWVGEMPASATLNPQLSISVVDETALAVRNRDGDAVPADATLTVTSNGTIYQAPFEERLPAGEVRYAIISSADGQFHLVDERAAVDDAVALSSPISVTVVTADGVTLHSSGMAWESSSGSESDDGGSSASSSESVSG